MFSGLHFAWLAICVAVIGGLLSASIFLKWKFKTAVYVAAGLAIASELVKVFTRIDEVAVNGGVEHFVQVSALPLHLCSMLIFLVFAMTFIKNKGIIEGLKSFYVPVALLGGVCSILIPIDGVSFANVKVWQGFIYHSGIIWFSLYLLITRQVDLGLKAYIRNLVITGSLIVVALWLNSALQIYAIQGLYDVNFFFLVHPPLENLPILNLNHGYGFYLFTVVACGFVLLTALHTGPIIKEICEWRKRKINKDNSGDNLTKDEESGT